MKDRDKISIPVSSCFLLLVPSSVKGQFQSSYLSYYIVGGYGPGTNNLSFGAIQDDVKDNEVLL